MISQAPLIFTFACLLVFALAYLLVKWQFRENLALKDSLIADKDSLIALLRDKASPEAPVSSVWEQDRKAINQAVQVVGFLVGNGGLRIFDKPHLNFQFRVFNGSVYEVSVDRKAEGYILFLGNKLNGRLEMLYDDQNVENLEHGKTATFGLRLWLAPSDAEYLIAVEDANGEKLWDFSYLDIMLTGDGFIPKRLSFDFIRNRAA